MCKKTGVATEENFIISPTLIFTLYNRCFALVPITCFFIYYISFFTLIPMLCPSTGAVNKLITQYLKYNGEKKMRYSKQ